jgi:RHS repeat-associated protein
VDLATRLKFTGKERDAETGLDYFGARYLSSAQGRYTSPDWSEKPQAVPYADFANPQTLNLYAYADNNPLKNRDLDGHCTIDGETHGKVWCWLHDHGHWVQTKHEQASFARTQLAPMHGFTINGRTPADVAKNGTDQEVINAYGAASGFLLGVGQESINALLGCGSKDIKCGIIPIGPLKGPIPSVTGATLAEQLTLEEAEGGRCLRGSKGCYDGTGRRTSACRELRTWEVGEDGVGPSSRRWDKDGGALV